LYFFHGPALRVDGRRFDEHAAIVVRSNQAARLEAGEDVTELLMLQGRPIQEPVVQHGPFVMNTRAEIQQAMLDYQRSGFGGWPWPSDDPVHAREAGRFARHADGRIERLDG
jgi:redox-sensitive bicupin YhaK (pirin superfamily)